MAHYNQQLLLLSHCTFTSTDGDHSVKKVPCFILGEDFAPLPSFYLKVPPIPSSCTQDFGNLQTVWQHPKSRVFKIPWRQEGWFGLRLHITAHRWEKPGQELEAETRDCFFLASLGPCPGNGAAYGRLGPPVAIKQSRQLTDIPLVQSGLENPWHRGI